MHLVVNFRSPKVDEKGGEFIESDLLKTYEYKSDLL